MRPYRSFVIREPKRRRICAAHFRDRVVQHAVCAVLDPVWESAHRSPENTMDPVFIENAAISTGPNRPEHGWQNRKRLAVRLAACTANALR